MSEQNIQNIQNIFGDSLHDHEKRFLERELQRTQKVPTSSRNDQNKVPLSFSNEFITFNPYQYKPYFKLIAPENNEQSVYIADEVGVGKTFETGIIITELLYQNLIQNVVIVCPNMLARKWQTVLQQYFGLGSSIFSGSNLSHITIVPYQKLKSLTENLNKEIGLLVIDEAHNGNGERGKYMKALGEKSSYRVLLSATPLSGQHNDWGTQTALLFKNSRPNEFSFTEENIYLCRTLKDEMREGDVKWHIENIPYQNEHFKKFLDIANILFRGRNTLRKFEGLTKLSSSFPSGESYAEKLASYTKDDLKKFILSSFSEDGDEDSGSYLEDTNLEECNIDEIFKAARNLRNSLSSGEVQQKDEKLEKLKEIILNNQEKARSDDPESEFYKKIIIFTNYNETAHYLRDELNSDTNLPKAVLINGELSQEEKWQCFQQFKKEEGYDLLIITNVAAEGQDMDFCNTIVNYDLHYNPVVLAQRKGRIDRFEVKKKKLFLYNFAIKGFDPFDSFDSIVPDSIYSVLSRKLNQIYSETGLFYNVINSPKPESSTAESTKSQSIVDIFQHHFPDDAASLQTISAIHDFAKEKGNCQEKTKEILQEKGIELSFDEDGDSIILKTSKHNQELLQHLFLGGTLTSHCIYEKEN